MSQLLSADKYPFIIRPLAEGEGGGFLIEFPDLPGCMSDGETPEEAFINGRDAVRSYLLSCQQHGDAIPKPFSADVVDWSHMGSR
jgi:antitoxin HicB